MSLLDTKEISARRDWLTSVLIGVVVGAALGEVWLRVTDFSYYWALARAPDPDLGWARPPHLTAWQRFEGEARVHINREGLRDREHPVLKPPGRVRVAVLGDSFTAAVQVPLEQTWWSVMDDRLASCRDAAGPLEVINFGVSGYSTAQELQMLRHRVWRFHPDLVLLAFFPGNDLNENLRELDYDPTLRPYFRERDGRLALDASFRDSWDYRFGRSPAGVAWQGLLRRSRLLQAVLRARDVIHLWWGGGAGARSSGLPGEPGVDSHIYLEPSDPAWRRTWAITEDLVETLAQETRAHGARFALISLTTGAQVMPNPWLRARLEQRLGVSDLFYPGRRLAALGRARGFAVYDLAPEMQASATWEGTFLHGFEHNPGIGHWNPAGHRLAGTLAAGFLCQSGLLEAPKGRPEGGAGQGAGG